MSDKHWPESLHSETWEIVRDSVLDAFIESTFGRPWTLQQNGEYLSNDSITYFEVYPDPDATAKVEEWLASRPASFPGRIDQKGDCTWNDSGNSLGEDVDIYTHDILSELCNRGLLPEGDMTVYVSW